MAKIIHLGDEGLETYVLAREHLRNGKNVTFVGLGQSMGPIIPDGTRMEWEPYKPNQKIEAGMPLFCRFSRTHYSCHMAWIISGDYVLIGTSHGQLEGWVNRHTDIIGVYKGAH